MNISTTKFNIWDTELENDIFILFVFNFQYLIEKNITPLILIYKNYQKNCLNYVYILFLQKLFKDD